MVCLLLGQLLITDCAKYSDFLASDEGTSLQSEMFECETKPSIFGIPQVCMLKYI